MEQSISYHLSHCMAKKRENAFSAILFSALFELTGTYMSLMTLNHCCKSKREKAAQDRSQPNTAVGAKKISGGVKYLSFLQFEVKNRCGRSKSITFAVCYFCIIY